MNAFKTNKNKTKLHMKIEESIQLAFKVDNYSFRCEISNITYVPEHIS